MTDERGYSVGQVSLPAEATVATSAAGDEVRRELSGIWAWIVEHDDSKLFLALYVGLAVVLSIWISLFWLVAVVAVHFAFEVIRQSHYRSNAGAVLIEALWELKLDVALVLFALVLTLYMELVLGVVGLQGAARIGAASRAATRFAGWERTLRGILLSVDDAAQVARAVGARRRGGAAAPVEAAATNTRTAAPANDSPWGSWVEPWSKGAWIAVGLGVVCIVLIATAPWLTPHTPASAIAALVAELRPLP